MSNTIELLEAIGVNAALRYAPAAQLIGALEGANASAALTRAISSGSGVSLMEDFGHKTMRLVQATPQASQTVWRELVAAGS
ncbi:hypothetical protein ACFWZ3_02640 [Frateuria sp. GZRR35]|uniref:hypothetical protein n=1 Tax=Frateuria sp. GZRR35 TaxID=3351536 RepID=UPI003EDC5EE8